MTQTWQPNAGDDYYDIPQILKRLDWLDAERRKDKDAIYLLQEQITQLRTENLALKNDIKDLQKEISVYPSVFPRLDHLEGTIAQNRGELQIMIEENTKAHTLKEAELEGNQRTVQESLSRAILELRKQVEPISDIKKAVQARMDDIFTVNRNVEELAHRIEKVSLERDDFLRIQKTNEESRKQDIKRLTDMQTELNAYRKRNEEMRTKVDISSDSIKRMETRINDVLSGENERRQQWLAFQEKINVADVNREKEWAEWKESFAEVVERASSLEGQVQTLDATKRSIKRSQDILDEASARFDRRTNELTEMQRLTEERFHQEWANFKAEDQKRWMNYSLGQDEIQSDYKRSVEMIMERLNKLEDTAVNTYDEAAQQNEIRTGQLQELYQLLRSWLEKN